MHIDERHTDNKLAGHLACCQYLISVDYCHHFVTVTIDFMVISTSVVVGAVGKMRPIREIVSTGYEKRVEEGRSFRLQFFSKPMQKACVRIWGSFL